jgi:hypothetical protein
MKCPPCQHENPADALLCQECVTRLEVASPGCGTANQLGAKFCKKCGQPVAMTAPAAAAASAKFLCRLPIRLLGSRRSPEVFVMEPTHTGHRHHPALARRLHAPWLGRVLGQG